MTNSCTQCGSTRIVIRDGMIICDDCLSTIVFNEDGAVYAEYPTNTSFKKLYSELKTSLQFCAGNYQSECSRLLSCQADVPPLLNFMGKCCIEEERYGDAIKLLKQAVDLNPRYITAYNNIAVAYHYFGYNDLAVKHFEHAAGLIDSKRDTYPAALPRMKF